MKIRIIICLVCLFSFSTVKAQDSELKQQIFVSGGLLDLSYLENFFNSSGGVSGLPIMGWVEYRVFRDHIGVGVSVFNRALNQEVWGENRAHRFYGVLPHFDFFWVNNHNYQVSSQLAIGYRFGQTIITDNNNAYFEALYRRAAFQLIPLSVTYGKGHWFGRFEVGLGHKGFGSLGIGLQL